MCYTTAMEKNAFLFLACVAMLTAGAMVLMYFEFPVPGIPPFYEMDFSEIPIIIGAFAMGPVAGVIMEFLKILLNLLFTGTSTVFVGEFAKFIMKNYIDWLNDPDHRPIMSPDIFKKVIFPLLNVGEQVYLVVFDNFRYDQWRVISQQLADDFTFDENLYVSILPTATQYARNSIFAGLMPNQIATMFPELWVDEDEEEGKNLNEAPLIQTQLDRYRRSESFTYSKLNHSAETEKLVNQFRQLSTKQLNVIVVNFIDMLSHARTESTMVRELASDEIAYRSITSSWFRHSPVNELFHALANTNAKIVITTDHGSIRVNNPTKIIGDKNTNTNLRYKLGKNLAYNAKDLFVLKNPKMAFLPAPNLSTSYVFAKGDTFFAYPNNYNYYVSYYKNTFQHGGISMEEMLIPLVTLTSKRKR